MVEAMLRYRSRNDNAFDAIDRMFSSEIPSSKKSNLHYETYFTRGGVTTTLIAGNAGYALEGFLGRLRKQTRKVMDLSQGYSIFKTNNAVNAALSNGQAPSDLGVMLPLPNFLPIFSNPPKFVAKVMEKYGELEKDWFKLNGAPEMSGRRIPIDKTFVVKERVLPAGGYRGDWGGRRSHRMVVICQLNSFAFTADQAHVAIPEAMQPKDIKVIFRIVKTLGADDIVDKSGLIGGELAFDKDSYSVTVPYFCELLQSDEFATYFEKASEIADQVLQENLEVDNANREKNRRNSSYFSRGRDRVGIDNDWRSKAVDGEGKRLKVRIKTPPLPRTPAVVSGPDVTKDFAEEGEIVSSEEEIEGAP